MWYKSQCANFYLTFDMYSSGAAATACATLLPRTNRDQNPDGDNYSSVRVLPEAKAQPQVDLPSASSAASADTREHENSRLQSSYSGDTESHSSVSGLSSLSQLNPRLSQQLPEMLYRSTAATTAFVAPTLPLEDSPENRPPTPVSYDNTDDENAIPPSNKGLSALPTNENVCQKIPEIPHHFTQPVASADPESTRDEPKKLSKDLLTAYIMQSMTAASRRNVENGRRAGQMRGENISNPNPSVRRTQFTPGHRMPSANTSAADTGIRLHPNYTTLAPPRRNRQSQSTLRNDRRRATAGIAKVNGYPVHVAPPVEPLTREAAFRRRVRQELEMNQYLGSQVAERETAATLALADVFPSVPVPGILGFRAYIRQLELIRREEMLRRALQTQIYRERFVGMRNAMLNEIDRHRGMETGHRKRTGPMLLILVLKTAIPKL